MPTDDVTLFGLARPSALLTALLMIGVAAVGGCSTEQAVRNEFSNQGEICVFPAGEVNGIPGAVDNTARVYAAGELVNVAVHFPTCLSSSCSSDRMASCTVSGTSGALQVTSSGSYVNTKSGICTTDCGFLIARCQTSALAAGTTTFQHGGTTLTLTLPFMGAPPCAGAPGR
jgi:hypothetical protein